MGFCNKQKIIFAGIWHNVVAVEGSSIEHVKGYQMKYFKKKIFSGIVRGANELKKNSKL